MAKKIEMTQLSPTMTEGTIVKWLKKEGDSISVGDILAEVETDKAVMEMEAYDNGEILKILAPAGTKCSVGAILGALGKKGEDISEIEKEAAQKNSASSATATAPTKDSPAAKSSTASGSTESPSTKSSVSTTTSSEANKNTETSKPASSVEVTGSLNDSIAKKSIPKDNSPILNTGRILASPLAKAIAIEKGINLKYVRGSGPEGRIVKDDVIGFETNGAFSSGNSFGSFAQKPDETIPLSGMRSVIAKRLSSSKKNIPHFYLKRSVMASKLVEFRENFNSSFAAKGIKISFNDLIIKATALALAENPAVNSHFLGESILQKGSIDIGMAVSIDGGLITPVIRSANHLTILQISQQAKELASRAKEKKLKPEEYTGGSFTISNLGMYGITEFSAIINEPESGILAVGNIEEVPVVRDGVILPGHVLHLTGSFDHRSVDGSVGALFLKSLAAILENPFRLLE